MDRIVGLAAAGCLSLSASLPAARAHSCNGVQLNMALLLVAALSTAPSVPAAPAALTGALLYVDFTKEMTVELVEEDLAAQTTQPILAIKGSDGGFFAQAATTSPSGSKYYTTLQWRIDAKTQYAQTLAIALDGEGGATLLHHLNTALCWHLSAEAKGGDLLCLAEVPCDPASGACVPGKGVTTILQRIDFAAGTNTTLGRYPEGQVCENEAAAYDPILNVYYAYLSNGVAAMDVGTGQLLWSGVQFDSTGNELLVHDFVADPKTGKAYVGLTSSSPFPAPVRVCHHAGSVVRS